MPRNPSSVTSLSSSCPRSLTMNGFRLAKGSSRPRGPAGGSGSAFAFAHGPATYSCGVLPPVAGESSASPTAQSIPCDCKKGRISAGVSTRSTSSHRSPSYRWSRYSSTHGRSCSRRERWMWKSINKALTSVETRQGASLRRDHRPDALAAPQRVECLVDPVEREFGRDEFGDFDLALPRQLDHARVVHHAAAERADDLDLAEHHPAGVERHRLVGRADDHEPPARPHGV